MKSSAPTAIALTLIMFLLVLIAGVFFWLYYERLSLQGELQSAHDNARILEAQQAENEVSNLVTKTALDTIMATSTSTAAENVERAKQLANSDQLNATMKTQEAQLSLNLEDAKATVTAFESQAPLITVVEPQANEIITVGQPVELVIVASDPAGVDSLLFNIGSDLEGGPIEEKGVTAIKRHSWTPTDAGPVTMSITATNVNGITSEPHTIALIVLAPATSTPEPTLESTIEPTPEN